MKNVVLNQMIEEISEWKRDIDSAFGELSKKMTRLVEPLKKTSHSFILEKIEHYQQLIINQNAKFNKIRRCLEEHEFRLKFINVQQEDLNVLILQHQSYRNEWEKGHLEYLALTMKFNGFFVDQLNSIVSFNNN